MPTEHIKETDVLSEGTVKLNKAIDQANKSEADAAVAKGTAKQALTNSENTQTQLDTIVINGDSSVEAAQARVDSEGTAHNTLKDRLDTEHGSVTSLLAQIVIQTISSVIGKDIPLNATAITNGFYNAGDGGSGKYVCLPLTALENFTDIGNGVFIGEDASIKITDTKKMKLFNGDFAYVEQLGGKPDDSTIDNSVVANIIMKNFYEVKFQKGLYYISTPLLHNMSNLISGVSKYDTEIYLKDNSLCYLIKTPNSDLDNAVFTYDQLTIKNLTLNGNSANNATRDYSGNTAETYWGFGTHITNIKNLNIDHVRVFRTNAYGIAFYIVENLHVVDYEVEQSGGINQDGISGTAVNVYMDGIKGFTGDDIIGLGVGGGSLEGYQAGLNAYIQVKKVEIRNVECIEKNGVNPHVAIGLYPHNGYDFEEVILENIEGFTRDIPIRFQNYWFATEQVKGFINKISLKNVTTMSKSTDFNVGLRLQDIDVNNFKLEKTTLEVNKTVDYYHLQMINAHTDKVEFEDIRINDISTNTALKTHVISHDYASLTKTLIVQDIEVTNSVLKIFGLGYLASATNIHMSGIRGTNMLDFGKHFIVRRSDFKINLKIDSLKLDFDTFFTISNLVNVTRKEAKILNGMMIFNVVGEWYYDGGTLGDVDVINATTNSPFGLENTEKRVGKLSANGFDMTIINSNTTVKILRPSFSNPSLVAGTYRIGFDYEVSVKY